PALKKFEYNSAPAAVEVPEKVADEPGHASLLRVFNPKQNQEAKKTVNPEEEIKTLVADLDEVFSLGYIPIDRFSEKIKNAHKKAADKNKEIEIIDFSKDGYITDAVIKTLFKTVRQDVFSHVSRVSLEGCSVITDVGLHWLVKGLSGSSNNIRININGCTKVTDGGLVTLANAPNIGTIDAIATSVVHMKQAGNTKGCPLLTDPSSITSEIHKESFLMVVPMATTYSLSEFVKSKSQEKREQFQFHHLKSLEISDWKVNVTELERNHVLFDHILPPNPVHVIITFDGHCSVQDLKGQVIETVAHILSKERVNPPHKLRSKRKHTASNCFFEPSKWSKCELTYDGNMKNTSVTQDVIGSIISHQPISRTNSYFEVQCTVSQPETGIVIGAIHDILFSERFPLESKELTGGVVEGVEMEENCVYVFGVKGQWISEFVPGEDAEFYMSQNGVELKDKFVSAKPHIGMYPMVAVIGKNIGDIRFLNMACPSGDLMDHWKEMKQYWTPSFKHNVLCDDKGIVSYQDSYEHSGERGIILCQETITREHNTFTIKVVDTGSSGVISMGLGPEDYETNRHPGWNNGSIGFHGDDGMVYVQSGSGTQPSSGEMYVWKRGDVISAVVSMLGEADTIEAGDEVQIDFYVNQKLMATVKTKLTGTKKGIRFVFMMGMRVLGTKAQILNFHPAYSPPPPVMHSLTFGRSNFINVFDSGRLVYRKYDNRQFFGLFMSKTPFNKALTYFEMEIKKMSAEKHVSIGFAGRDYPINKMLGWLLGSLGFHGDNGQLYNNSSSGTTSHLDPSGTNPFVFVEGAIVGCGFDEASAKFREDGSLENQQMLKFYFTLNKQKIHEVDFEYRSGGIFPAVNLHHENDEVILKNLYMGVEPGNIEINTSKIVTEENPFVEGCHFTLVGVQDGGSNLEGRLQLLEQVLSDGLEFPVISLIDQQIQIMESNQKLMDFQGQELYAQLCWQKECLERFSQNSKSRIKFLTVDVSSGEGHKDLMEHIVKVCEMDLNDHKNYYCLDDSVVLGLEKITEKLSEEKLLAADNLLELVGDQLGHNGRVFEAAVRYLQSKGHLFWVPMQRTIIAIDLHFAEALIRMSMVLPNTLSGNINPAVGEETKIWSDVTEIIPDAKTFSPSKLEILSHVLYCMGVMEIRRLRASKEDPMFFYCTSNGIGALPVEMTHFMQSANKDTVLIERDYQFLFSSPKNILPMVVSRCLLFSRALVIARSWAVFQNGAAQTIIYVNGEQGLRVETRCFMPTSKTQQLDQDTEYHVQEYTFNIFCLFTDIIDLLVGRLRLRVINTQKVPNNMVNRSIGCVHNWGLSDEDYRQTVCTLCGLCCEKGHNCPYNGISGEFQHQCGCDTHCTGCQDCGICQKCADLLWTIRSYLRPNLEVACHGKMRSNPYIPLNATTYDEVEFTNLGRHQAPICLKVSSGHASTAESMGVLTKMFPYAAIEFPNLNDLEQYMTKANSNSKMMTFNQGDTVKIKLDPIKRDSKTVVHVDEESVLEITPVYFTCICRESTVWHDTGIVAYTSISRAIPVGQFISASPLTPECPSFSFEIVNPGDRCFIVIGVCNKRYPPDRQPGWNLGSVAYHADDGGIFTGAGFAMKNVETSNMGDILKLELDFEKKHILFYKNGKMIHQVVSKINNVNDFYPAVGFHSVGEAVRLLEKEPWQMSGDEEPVLPAAFDCYKYGNMYISPGRSLSMNQIGIRLQGWLMIYNPSKSIVGYKIFPTEIMPGYHGYLEPSKLKTFQMVGQPSHFAQYPFVDVHWFLLESNRDYKDVDINSLYSATTTESLLKHRLKVKIVDVQSSELRPLKLAKEEPDATDCYHAEVFKNGISVEKYWLKGGNYVCCLPQNCNVLVRYPKFPTLDQPNGFQKWMRLILELPTKSGDVYAEALIEEVTQDGHLRLQYSQPQDTSNECTMVRLDAPEINIQNIEYVKITRPAQAVPQTGSEKGNSPEEEQQEEQVLALNLISFQPRGNMCVTKRAYEFPPFHLLTEYSQAAIKTLDCAWKANTLNSVAQCKNMPTRLTVQEFQINSLAGSDKNWLIGANPSKKFDMAFAFLPSKLGHTNLCFPSIPWMFTEIDVHVLCFLVDQMYFNLKLEKDYEICLDVPLHFVNVSPITPSPALSPQQMFASSFNGWVYTTLYSNKLCLPVCDNMFTEGRPDFQRPELEHLMKSLLHIYAAQCHIFAEQHGGIMFQVTPEDGTSTITDSIHHMRKTIIKTTDQAELKGEILMKKEHRNNVYCKAHQWCLPGTNIILEGPFDFRDELFTPYQESVNLLWRERLAVETLPKGLYSLFTNLQYFKLQGCDSLKVLPDGISKCLRLEMLYLEDCGIEQLPTDLFQVPYLQRLYCNALAVKALPSAVLENSKITYLSLSNLLLTHIPKELGRLICLEYLDLNSNPLETLPMELVSLTKLKTLLLCGIPWIVTSGSKAEIPIDQYEDFLKTNPSLTRFIGKEKLVSMFHDYDQNKNSRLDETEIAALNTNLFWKVPRLGSSCINCSEYGGIPPVIFLLSGLETLHLDFQAITTVPVHMCRLQNLKILSISNNPLLEGLPGALGHLPSLKSLRLISNPSLRTPPHEVVSRGFASIKAYLKRLAGGFIECRRTKLMLVGLGGAGKTSLLKALMSTSKITAGTKGEDITNGIDILSWTVKTSNNVEVTYNTWDFAGQTLYYNTHQFFLSKRAVYLLLWSTRQGFEHAGLEFWLSSIASHAPNTPIFVIGTHCDQVPKADIPMVDLKERYPQIAGFHFVSSIEGIGIRHLEEELLRVTLEQKNMGEKVPKVWLNLEKRILADRVKTSILPWKTIQEYGMNIGIYDEKDIREAVQFLHELGTVQYFDNEFLREQVVINPQWIVNVMSCVVSVKNSPIQEHHGRFLHKYIPEIWHDYPESLHQWLLQLTEQFDLTFPIPEEPVNIVPCLLPQEVPSDLTWTLDDISKNEKETKLVYQFSYLPAGLFNRAQVRLFQLSDGKLIWKRGSLLKKNKHEALILQTSDCELQVKVKGPRPENVIFLIHEIFESLIEESFHGVVYEFLVPCPDCVLKEGTRDPAMFERSLIKLARENRAPFLQCRKFFHTISMSQLVEGMPSDGMSDIDAQLQHSLTVMQQLNSALSTDVTIIYSAKDKVGDDHKTQLNPGQIKKDIEAAKISCWFSDSMESVSEQDVMLALKNCKVVVALVSDNFESDARSNDHVLYAIDTLHKDFCIVVIGESLEWQKTDLGMRIGKQEEMVMIRTKNRYDESRIEQLVATVRSKLKLNQQQLEKHPSVFISYSWSNSKHAVERGTKADQSALGWGDPRQVKIDLEKRGFSCWLDYDQPPAGKGLFKTISEGMRNSKVLVAFVSDEYVKSDNCMMELRFGVLTLELPTIIVVVGTGREWKKSEVGILATRANAERVYMQQENPEALNVLETFIRKKLPENSDQMTAKRAVKQNLKAVQEQEKNKVEKKKTLSTVPDNTAIQEESELIQRKFMRHIITYISSKDSFPTPRLIVIDFEKPDRHTNKRDHQNDTDSLASHMHSKVRPALRPKTASRSSKFMTEFLKIMLVHSFFISVPFILISPISGNAYKIYAVVEDEDDKWDSEQFCWKLLCEDEKGWHLCKTSYPVKMTPELKETLQKCSSYFARMFAILRQSAVNLNCFEGPLGTKFTTWIEQSMLENINFLDSYIAFRTNLVDDDSAQPFLSQLKRCHLATGKINWLCDVHSEGPRITKLS
ncbi:unnamed protein product, partial [Lymnaea stagnalis]